MFLPAVVLGLFRVSTLVVGLPPDRPELPELMRRYEHSALMGNAYRRLVFNADLAPHWIGSTGAFWYQSLIRGKREFVLVEPGVATQRPAFDHQRLASALSQATGVAVHSDNLPFDAISFDDARTEVRFKHANKQWMCDLTNYTLKSGPVVEAPSRAEEPWVQNLWPPDTSVQESPDHVFKAHISGLKVVIDKVGGTSQTVHSDGGSQNYYARLVWSPDGKRLIAIRVIPGDRKKVYLIQSTPPTWGPAEFKERIYDRPGDRVDTFQIETIDPESAAVTKVDAEPVDYGEMPDPRWLRDGRTFTYEKMDRGYGRYRIIEVDSQTGQTVTRIDEHPSTFVDSTSQYIYYCKDSDEMVYRSERDGFGRLYLASREGELHPFTPEGWVVREVVRVDEKARRVFFSASGMNANEDPYFIHYFAVNFDGSGLTSLTPALGNHRVEISPDSRWLVDTYSQVDVAPVHELRNAAGGLVMRLETADTTDLAESGLNLPEPFVAKGRDGRTNIYGVVYRPSYLDPHKSYPILEDIYAGPHDSFVPKSFGQMGSDHAMAELGFVVVKIDGMGTRNRGKAFQDVCYKNLADAGFPDRILWMQALHAKYPYADIGRVGAFGTSAGGQSAAGSVLFHPEFYKAAVASCGCHDNRLDKIWWNEQWMGKIGPHYMAQSNITNAAKLKGALLLIVGELDTNVPPESTYRFAAALQAAKKNFELVIIPNSDHTSGGPYGEHKRRDFFIKNLIGVDPPNWNQ